MSEDFEGSFPRGFWDVSDNSGLIFGDYYWGQRDCEVDTGSLARGRSAPASMGRVLGCDTHYPNGADSWMVYGPFSLADATDAELLYRAWVNVFSDDDRLCHMASVDGEYFYGSCTTDTFPQRLWTERVFDLTDVYTLGDLRGKPLIWIAFIFTSDSLGSAAEGAHVDDILLHKQVGTGAVLSQADRMSQGTDGWRCPGCDGANSLSRRRPFPYADLAAAVLGAGGRLDRRGRKCYSSGTEATLEPA